VTSAPTDTMTFPTVHVSHFICRMHQWVGWYHDQLYHDTVTVLESTTVP